MKIPLLCLSTQKQQQLQTYILHTTFAEFSTGSAASAGAIGLKVGNTETSPEQRARTAFASGAQHGEGETARSGHPGNGIMTAALQRYRAPGTPVATTIHVGDPRRPSCATAENAPRSSTHRVAGRTADNKLLDSAKPVPTCLRPRMQKCNAPSGWARQPRS